MEGWVDFTTLATLGFLENFVLLENLVYHFFRQLWLVLGVKLMEINSNLFSRLTVSTTWTRSFEFCLSGDDF